MYKMSLDIARPNHIPSARSLELGLSLVSCFIAGLGCGTLYLYSAYAPQLASELSLNATNTSLIGMIGNLSSAFTGPFAGILVDRRGPTIPLSMAAIAIFIGYFIIRIAYSSQISSIPLLSSAMLFVGSGSTLGFAALVKCAALNFPASRGIATSVPMAAFGLSAFFLSSIASITNPGDTYGLLCILSFLPVFLFIITWPFIKIIPLEYISVNNRPSMEVKRTAISDSTLSEKDHNITTLGQPLASDSSIDIHGTRLLRSKLFWLHFFLLGTLAGVGQMYIYSCGYCVRALIEDPDANSHILQKLQSIQVGVISVTSFGGRILSGFLSDYVHNRHHLPRTVLLIGSSLIMLVAQALAFSVTSASDLWIASAATGLAYGICYGSYPTIIGDTFGMRHFSQNWGFLALSPVPTSYILNMMFGALYDINSTVDENSGHRICTLGKDCYSRSFVVTACAVTTALLVLIPYMMMRKRR